MNEANLLHWADFTAAKIIKTYPGQEEFTVASGITPSGVVHFGNFREVITVDLVARALRAQGKKVRFIFSWDDYDTFRKVPKNMPQPEMLERYLFWPIIEVPDPYGEEESYARHHEVAFEKQLKEMGIEVEFIYQASRYRSGAYTAMIQKALDEKEAIKKILNAYRTSPLPEDWLPLSLYCEKCHRDRIAQMTYHPQDASIEYTCELCGHPGEEPLAGSQRIKLPWRVDWPMRWAQEKVNFEPGGKDHSSDGGSFTTAQEIVKIFGHRAPVYLQYDFVSVKGQGGKMSSSKGDLVTVNDVLKVYTPEMIRWIFASYKSNVDFSISFDGDAIRIYEDYDRFQRLVHGLEPQANEKKLAMAQRVYFFSQRSAPANGQVDPLPWQAGFRHMANVYQIHKGDTAKVKAYYADQLKTPADEHDFTERLARVKFWLENYAPDEFIFRANEVPPSLELAPAVKAFVNDLGQALREEGQFASSKDVQQKIYDLQKQHQVDAKEAFRACYQLLISKDQGPKLAEFIWILGLTKAAALLQA
ncbi:MAG: lysine--tRNA ligase [Bacteriovoracaceae bacterium]|nr:lysine--tRNA ligase [Bacteriovoracaceae bacterium]